MTYRHTIVCKVSFGLWFLFESAGTSCYLWSELCLLDSSSAVGRTNQVRPLHASDLPLTWPEIPARTNLLHFWLGFGRLGPTLPKNSLPGPRPHDFSQGMQWSIGIQRHSTDNCSVCGLWRRRDRCMPERQWRTAGLCIPRALVSDGGHFLGQEVRQAPQIRGVHERAVFGSLDPSNLGPRRKPMNLKRL